MGTMKTNQTPTWIQTASIVSVAMYASAVVGNAGVDVSALRVIASKLIQEKPVVVIHSHPVSGERMLGVYDPATHAFLSVTPDGAAVMRTPEGKYFSRKAGTQAFVSYERKAGGFWYEPVAQLQERITAVTLFGILDREDDILVVESNERGLLVSATYPRGVWALYPDAELAKLNPDEKVTFLFDPSGRLLEMRPESNGATFVPRYKEGTRLGVVDRTSDSPESWTLVESLDPSLSGPLLDPNRAGAEIRRLVDRANSTRILAPTAATSLPSASPNSSGGAVSQATASPDGRERSSANNWSVVIAGIVCIAIGGGFWLRRRATA